MLRRDMQQPLPFGKYLLLERISVGGMAEVFKAKSFGVNGFAKIIAIKKILPQLAEDAHFVDMFVNEAKMAVQLTHANICQIYDLGRENGDHFIAMEYIGGKDLLSLHNHFRRTKTRMPVALIAHIGAKIAEALDYAHRKRGVDGEPLGIVHRDISPQNVIISFEGSVKVIDFGIAKARSRNQEDTQAGVLKGKFGYMSPEQIDGARDIDHRSDIFAIGTVVHELLTGRRLFLGESDFATLEQVRGAKVELPSVSNPDVPPELDAILMHALARRPDDRYPWAGQMGEELAALSHRLGASFPGQALGEWMREHFAADIAKEKARHELYSQMDGNEPDDSIEDDRTEFNPLPPLLSGDEEEETQLWEPEEEEKGLLEKAAASMSFAPAAVPRVPRSTTEEAPPAIRPPTVQSTPSPHAATTAQLPTANTDSAILPSLLSHPPRLDILRAGLIALAGLLLATFFGAVAYRTLFGRPTVAETTSMVIRVEPVGDATFYLDNRVVSSGAVFSKGDLRVGPHTLRIERLGFETYKSSLNVAAHEAFKQTIRLTPTVAIPARILFRLTPKDAELSIDGRQIPIDERQGYVAVAAGRRVAVKAARDGYKTYEGDLVAESGVSRPEEITLAPLGASLFIDSDPPADVFIDGVYRGRTPQKLLDLDPLREYDVRIERPGFETYAEHVQFGDKRVVQIEPRLKKASQTP